MLLAFTRAEWSAIVVGGGVLVVAVVELLLAGRIDDRATRFGLRRGVRFATVLVVLLALAGIWQIFGRPHRPRRRPRSGRARLRAAECNRSRLRLDGDPRQRRLPDRRPHLLRRRGGRRDRPDTAPHGVLEMGSPLELGTEVPATTWVRGRQYSGRVVAVPNYRVLTDPVYNYSGAFEYIWEELTLPVSYRSDWRQAEQILLEEVGRASDSEGAKRAMEEMARRYPVPQAEVEPNVFVRATDNWWEISGRFVVPIRTVRTTKSELTKRVRERFDEAGIELSSATNEQFVRFPQGLPQSKP